MDQNSDVSNSKPGKVEAQALEPHSTRESHDAGEIDPEHRLERVNSRRSRSRLLQSIGRSAASDPFANSGEGTHYRSMTWWQAGFIMIAETVSLGILSLPSVVMTLGLVPAIILIIAFGVISGYTGFIIGQLKLAYPWIHTFADAAEIIASPFGLGAVFREFVGAAQVLLLIFVMGSHILTWTICMNTITGHPMCTIIWSVIGVVILFFAGLPRTLKSVSWLSIISCTSVLSAVMVTMVGIGVDPPQHGPLTIATSTASFASGFGSVTNIIFSFSGHSAYFQFIAELKDPRDFVKALVFLQSADTTLYLVSAIVIYVYAGDQVVSPALGSASPTVAKVAWGLAIPTILIAAVIYAHVTAKYIYVRALRNTRHLAGKTLVGYATWAGILLILWILAWIVAESIPIFNDLLGLIASLFVSWFAYGLPAAFWLFLNWDRLFSTPKRTFLTILNGSLIAMAMLIMVAGMYAVGIGIAADTNGAVWSCANNAG